MEWFDLQKEIDKALKDFKSWWDIQNDRYDSYTKYIYTTSTYDELVENTKKTCEIYKLLGENEAIDPLIKQDLNKAIDYAVNVDSRNILYTGRQNQKEFYQSLQLNKEKIDMLQPYMNRKTKRIFAYNMPYCLWQCQVWGYRIVNNIKQRESIKY